MIYLYSMRLYGTISGIYTTLQQSIIKGLKND